jgi:WXG100 family type VII secretion target
VSDGGTFLRVSFGALDETHADLGRAISQLTSQLDDLDRAARPLVATWQGAAQEAYSQHQAGWTRAANDLKGILASIRQALGDSMQAYQATETRNTRRFQ